MLVKKESQVQMLVNGNPGLLHYKTSLQNLKIERLKFWSRGISHNIFFIFPIVSIFYAEHGCDAVQPLPEFQNELTTEKVVKY